MATAQTRLAVRIIVTTVLALVGAAATATAATAGTRRPPAGPAATAAAPSAAPSAGPLSWPGKLGLGLAGASVVLVVGLVRRSTWAAAGERLRGRRSRGAQLIADPAPPEALVGAAARATAPTTVRESMPSGPLGRPSPAKPAAAPPAGTDRLDTTPTPGASAPMLRADIDELSDREPVTVLLVGSRTALAAPAWLWLDPTDEAPTSTYVALGDNEQGRLWIDLIRAPDVLTLTGDPATAQRMGAALADQLVRNQVPVTVVGSALGPRRAGVHVVRSLTEAAVATDDPTSPQIIFSSSDPVDRATVRRLTGRSTPRTVLVLLGDGRQGRWSIQVQRR